MWSIVNYRLWGKHKHKKPVSQAKTLGKSIGNRFCSESTINLEIEQGYMVERFFSNLIDYYPSNGTWAWLPLPVSFVLILDNQTLCARSKIRFSGVTWFHNWQAISRIYGIHSHYIYDHIQWRELYDCLLRKALAWRQTWKTVPNIWRAEPPYTLPY